MNNEVENNNIYLDQDALSLKDVVLKVRAIFSYLRTKIVYIFCFGVVGGIYGGARSFLQNPIYVAEMTFVLEGSGQGASLGGYSGLASQFGIDMGGTGGQSVFEGENLLALMKSRSMNEKALLKDVLVSGERITLAEHFLRFSGVREKWVKKESPLGKIEFPAGSDPSKFSLFENQAISIIHNILLNNNLNVDKRDKKSGIISVRVMSENEIFSKNYVENLTKVVSSFYVETKTKKSSENLRILEHQTDSIKRRLNISIIGAASSVDANPNPNQARQILRVPFQKNQGEIQINQEILSQLIQNLEIAKMTVRTETPLIQIIDSPILPLEKQTSNLFSETIKWTLLFSLIISIALLIRRGVTNAARS